MGSRCIRAEAAHANAQECARQLHSEFDAEPFTGGQTNARTSVRAGKSRRPCWPTIHLEHSCSATRRFGTGDAARTTGKMGQDASSERGAKKVRRE